MKSIKDNFSKQASTYAQFRPIYPDEIYQWIISNVKQFDLAWDVACGNGQVSQHLYPFFKEIFASDISQNQIDQAFHHSKITYVNQRAESSSLSNESVDLICVAQALHWFDFDAFFKEVKRVLKPEGIFATWGYGLFKSTEKIDCLVQKYYNEVVGPYWDAERIHIENEYKDIAMPFNSIVQRTFEIKIRWNCTQVLGYFDSWSATQKYKNALNTNPMSEEIRNAFENIWKDEIEIILPIFVYVCKY